ncbi:hypothetical protein G6F62_000685 [Rhizopus arrhizus]|uniref:Uncharacterized protein n=1 Tax=Rhizopus oryzae TaxID=64495 RepID=A0A9P6XJ02_RHIOR|nr:hypothetical protein G6F23_000475 [Rhizopus arrhizus]KAG0770129.1 hypothetical protein G6F24_000480 [Rhizopus arrhizus]KAG0797935.1 hypothetical protein G6F21_000128 [Rhizopus arrhizus]KAG0802184.1 hypothetical protein G6F22_000515 [Rhizopus arrhizus]KAG0817532.1 hypothetical protein G6F20_002304 [Rhizopus arrhizus]
MIEDTVERYTNVLLDLINISMSYIMSYPVNILRNNADDLINVFVDNFKEKNAKTATAECDNVGIRDRAYVYWHLLSTYPQAAKAVVLILTSVYHKSAETFIAGKKFDAGNLFYRHMEDEDINIPSPQIQATIKNNDIGNLLDLDWDEPTDEVPTSPILMDRNQHR